MCKFWQFESHSAKLMPDFSGNARIAGLTTDFHLGGLQYNTAVTLFFPPYCLFEVPSNIVLKIIRLST